jgi:hypothetical protein
MKIVNIMRGCRQRLLLLRGAGGGGCDGRSSRGLLLIAATFLGARGGCVGGDAFAGNGDESQAASFQWIVPADAAALRIKTEDFAAGGGEQIRSIEYNVHELGSFQRRRPDNFARRGIHRHHRAPHAEVDDFRHEISGHKFLRRNRRVVSAKTE